MTQSCTDPLGLGALDLDRRAGDEHGAQTEDVAQQLVLLKQRHTDVKTGSN